MYLEYADYTWSTQSTPGVRGEHLGHGVLGGHMEYAEYTRSTRTTAGDDVLRMLLRNCELEYELARNLGQVVKDHIVFTGAIGDSGWGMRAYGGKNMTSAAGVVRNTDRN
ncbi:Protein mono-ADP-ribosyltransferase PARP12 [Frankliniella fusca]|uniref:Protein mono-ADP-ribosyltransferase PARP12 n=1 Tax=Frankliniella fusca TaxID=407009 RepID=A0AAE1GV30_9NEOP|nr:Protein mono-ADP-ribosyltransferase PARP12 [Frankliniella fusca]